ncbi:hypothetical protein L6164_022251 [Bauhinia variegata]|uniref:Uncharacterized protein n=1 Tax=Bauhinia variegata TaxID=167791 RepID=A0ACB9MEI7_BAUVA|nr:hypothetical protein L6164_022251 [Bauhinia variegata]
MVAALETFTGALLVAILVKLAMATNRIVGGPNGGWDTNSNLQAWASSQNLLVGDNLVFQYPPNHDVVEVSKADYDSCRPSNPIQSYNGGATSIPLSSPGKRYFICGTLGHCSQGMKVEIDTLASAASSASPAASPSPADSPLPLDPPVPSPAPESTISPAESPELTPEAPSPVFGNHLDSHIVSPVIPSTEVPVDGSPLAQHSTDPSAASAKKGNLQSLFAFGFSFLIMLLAI